MKIFNNREITGLAILQKGNIIKEKGSIMYHNYIINALRTTFLITFDWKDILNDTYAKFYLFNDIITSYEYTLYKYQIVHSITLHKCCKNRVIQLILCLCQEFAVLEESDIMIPFFISQSTISSITGCNKSNVSKIMNELGKHQIISYSYQKYICLHEPFKLIYLYTNNTQNKT